MTSPQPPDDPFPSESEVFPGRYPLPEPRRAAAGVGEGQASAVAMAGRRELRESDLRSPRQRRRRVLPLILFLATCASTFWVGATDWMPLVPLGSLRHAYLVVHANWPQGLTYMAAILAILLTHEMGHFLFTVHYHIPASYPLFIPVPINPIGTMGAVIGMDGLKANRKELFDLGLAGPLAGLVVAVPIMWVGVMRLQVHGLPAGDVAFHNPLLVQWMIGYLRPDLAADMTVGIGQLNPYFIAGWVGLLITGLNMLPISQLDGGHVIYSLFGKRAHTIARGFLVVAIAFIVININQAYIWTMMLILVILMGTDHPPTSDDTVVLGRARWAIGVASLTIPVLCFPVWGIEV
jgi:Zn-dependent protease